MQLFRRLSVPHEAIWDFLLCVVTATVAVPLNFGKVHQVFQHDLPIPIPVKRLETRFKALLVNSAVRLHVAQDSLYVGSEHIAVNVPSLLGVNLVINAQCNRQTLKIVGCGSILLALNLFSSIIRLAVCLYRS